MMDDKRRRFEAEALPHLDAAYNLARWLTRSDADADDVVQETMLRAFRAFDGIHGDNVKAWLLRIVRNCFITKIRQTQSRGHVPLPDESASADNPVRLVAEGPDPEAAAVAADEGRKLNKIIAGLPDEFREVLVLREMENLSYREIAEITDCPMGTVMSRLARSRALLRERWINAFEGGTEYGVR